MTSPSAGATVAFGEALWDMLPTGAVLGGAPLNFAYRAKSLGLDAVLVSAVGDDELGREALDQIRRLGLPREYVAVADRADLPTGVVNVTLDEHRNPTYEIVAGVAYDGIHATPAIDRLAADAACVCYGTLVQRSAQSRETLRRLLEGASRALRVYDINLRPKCYFEEIIRRTLHLSSALKLNHAEAAYLARIDAIPASSPDRFAREVAERYELDYVIITYGDAGAGAYDAGSGAWNFETGYLVDVDDPCGSGDAFTAAFVATILAGGSVGDGLKRGNAYGALVATQPGATQPVSSAQIADLGQSGRRRAPVRESDLLVDPADARAI